MALKNIIAEEVKSTPISSISAFLSTLIATLSLLFAWSQSGASGGYRGVTAGTAISYPGEFSLGNAALVVAYFISITISAALLLRVVARKYDLAAFLASIPLMALTNFSTILIIYLAPPRALSSQLFASAHDLVFYASAAIVIAFCGKAVLTDLASTMLKEKANEKQSESNGDGIGVLFLAAILLAIWSWLVFAGQTRMTRTLLPEITHTVNTKQSPPQVAQ